MFTFRKLCVRTSKELLRLAAGAALFHALGVPAAAQAAEEKPYYVIAVQCGSFNFMGGEAQLEESYKALRGMVKLADAQNARLTLLFSPQYAVYIASDPARLAELEGWKKTGHEVGAYHRGPASRGWDGYSDLAGEALARARKQKGGAAPVPGHREYFEALSRLEPGIRSGCMANGADKEFQAASPPYEICGSPGQKGINKSLVVAGGGKKPEKLLSSFHPADKAGIETAEKLFSGMRSGVYGTIFKSSPSEFGAFYAWLAYLRGIDPQGARSRTVYGIAAGGLLPEKKAVREKETVKIAKPEVQPRQEAVKREIPRLKPVRSFYGSVGKVMFGPPFRGGNMKQRGRCGDGICDAFERARSGVCAKDCGN